MNIIENHRVSREERNYYWRKKMEALDKTHSLMLLVYSQPALRDYVHNLRKKILKEFKDGSDDK